MWGEGAPAEGGGGGGVGGCAGGLAARQEWRTQARPNQRKMPWEEHPLRPTDWKINLKCAEYTGLWRFSHNLSP